MGAETATLTKRKSVGPVAIFLSVIVLAAWFFWLAHTYFGPPRRPPKTAAELKIIDRMKRLARETKGDANKLNSEDRAWIERTTFGHGQQAIKGYWHDQQ